MCSGSSKMWCFCWIAQLPACAICLPVNLAIACGRHCGVEVSTVTGNGEKVGFLFSCGKVFQLDWTCVGHLDSCFSMGKFLIGLNLHWSPGFLFSYGEISDWTEPVLVTWIPVYPWGNFWLDWTCLGHQDSCFLIGLNLYWSSGFLFPHTLNSPPHPPPPLPPTSGIISRLWKLPPFYLLMCAVVMEKGSSTFEEVGWGLHCVVWFSSSFYDILVKLKYCCY